jgi:hypothetical protein
MRALGRLVVGSDQRCDLDFKDKIGLMNLLPCEGKAPPAARREVGSREDGARPSTLRA